MFIDAYCYSFLDNMINQEDRTIVEWSDAISSVTEMMDWIILSFFSLDLEAFTFEI